MNKKEILYLSIGFFLTVFAWLIADVYHAITREKERTNITVPVVQTYSINKETLNILKEKNP